MVDLEALAERAERTATWSRARMACRVCAPIALLAFMAICSGGSATACICLGAALFVLGAALRWRGRIGVECVTNGLVLGAVPAVAGVVLQCCGLECRGVPTTAAADLLYLLATVLAGVGVTWHASRASGARRQRWIATMLVASATAALGCLSMGVAALAATLLSVVAAGALALIPMSVRTG